MLDSLHIENMAVIASLDVDFSAGLSVITGETGAGKSVMLDCLSFLLGGKAQRELVRNGAEYGMVSAVFSDPGKECLAYLEQAGFPASDELLIERTLYPDGKSKCRLNGRMIVQAMLKELAGYLVSIHGQNDNQRLMLQSTQQRILDGMALCDEELSAYRAAYQAWRDTDARLHALHSDAGEAARLADILRFQIAEIDAAHLRPGEEEELLASRTRLQNAEKISKQSEFVYRVLHGSEKGAATLILDRAAQALHQLASMIPEAHHAAEKLTNMRYEIEDIANTASEYAADVDSDPTRALDRVESRLDTITRLRRKYGADIPAILAFRADAVKRLDTLESSEEEMLRLEALLGEQRARMSALADTLHEAREAAAGQLSAGVMEQLAFLDMPFVRFSVCVKQAQVFGQAGNDTVEFLISTNPGDPEQSLSRIASGGELARIMLAIKSVLNDRDGVLTAVFDEVDTGISGKTSRKIGIKLAEIGRCTQVLCVTHSAQIASLAHTHYKITKDVTEKGAFSSVKALSEEERVAEVARILGGLSVTSAQIQAARDMIDEGRLSIHARKEDGE